MNEVEARNRVLVLFLPPTVPKSKPTAPPHVTGPTTALTLSLLAYLSICTSGFSSIRNALPTFLLSIFHLSTGKLLATSSVKLSVFSHLGVFLPSHVSSVFLY